jgi:hypothetical protein
MFWPLKAPLQAWRKLLFNLATEDRIGRESKFSFTSPMLLAQRVQEPLYSCFSEVCPHCRKATEFWLVQASGRVWLGIFPVPFGRDQYLLRCQLCGYAQHLEKNEEESYSTVSELYQRFRKGEFGSREFNAQLNGLSVPTLRRIQRAAAAFWHCSVCAEENPSNFGECWNCHQLKEAASRL